MLFINGHIEIANENRWNQVSMKNRLKMRMPSTTNSLESTHGHLNKKTPRRNNFWQSVYRIVSLMIQKTNSYDDNITHNYNYEKALYEREVDRINAKTEKLQEEDRALELEINQLDTEHNAISTEMDSVKKVIEDTMEKVFKTFSG